MLALDRPPTVEGFPFAGDDNCRKLANPCHESLNFDPRRSLRSRRSRREQGEDSARPGSGPPLLTGGPDAWGER